MNTGLVYRCKKWLTVVTQLPSAFSEDSAFATPPSQQFRAAPPGNRTREHRSGPRSSQPPGRSPRTSLNRIGSASPLSQPVLRCKRRSQLSRDRAPVRPHVLHPLPSRYGEGDVNAVANGTDPSARNALRAAKQTPGQRQSRCLVGAEPVRSMNFTRPMSEL